MSRAKFSLDFKGFAEYAEKLDRLGGDLRAAADEALKQTADHITGNLEADMTRHNKSGKTVGSLVKNQSVEWVGNVAEIDVGFDIANGGLPSVFLMYGTPRHGPIGPHGGHPGTDADKKLYNDIYGSGTKRKVREIQEKVFAEAIKRKMGG